MVTILITGGTGFIGKHLQDTLKKQGFKIKILSRNPKTNNAFYWDIATDYIDKKAFKNVTHIIHLAGAGIADKRWTNNRKKELIDSRVLSTNLVLKKVKEYQVPLQGFITASAIGYYGAITSEKTFSETSLPANDFIAKVCTLWEQAALQFKELNIPVTVLRTGIVLAKNGGALQKMNTPLFLATLGNGKQYMPWIHIDDLCNLYVKAINNKDFKGVFNAVAPQYETNYTFTKTLGDIIKKITLPIGVPSFILKIILGELAIMLLKGSKVSAEKTAEFYNYKFPNLKAALNNIYNNE